MKPTRATLALASVVLLALLSSASVYAWGHRGPHARFGVMLGGPLWYGPAYYSPYYYPPYYPQAYYPSMPVAPPVYVEQGEAQPATAPPQAYWHYCAETKGYYPYVKECPGGWQRVSPQPPPG